MPKKSTAKTEPKSPVWEAIDSNFAVLVSAIETAQVVEADTACIENLEKWVDSLKEALLRAEQRAFSVIIQLEECENGDEPETENCIIIIDGKTVFNLEDVDGDLEDNEADIRAILEPLTAEKFLLHVNKAIYKHDFDTTEEYNVVITKEDYLKDFTRSFY